MEINEPKFYQAVQNGITDAIGSTPTPFPHNMTRDQWRHELAARAMEGMLASDIKADANPKQLGQGAYQFADAMIEEGEKDGK